ncbi:MAG: HlyD family type I secretion periplasmic adaptor subunit [Alphaproteobacteria bacterium]|nr:HlyD family type I secretion periplasmic adaptor subunit [Alphaproteobacteria bacterium]
MTAPSVPAPRPQLVSGELAAPLPWQSRLDERAIPVPAAPDSAGTMLFGYVVLVVFVLGFLGWASLAPLASATIASGIVKAEGNRRTIQHLEGGIVREILARDGDVVRAGQVLARLDDTQSAAAQDLARAQLDTLLALEARLIAERDDVDTVVVPPDLLRRQSDARVAAAVEGQRQLFDTRRRQRVGQVAILDQRIAQLRAQISSHEAQVTSMDVQLRYIDDEIRTVRDLVARGYERRPRLLALQRQAAALRGNGDEQRGQIARAEQGIAEARMQIAQVTRTFSNEVVQELRETQAKIGELEERFRAAADVQARRDVLAPVAGSIVNQRIFTVGGVVRPGETLFEILPHDDELVIEAQVAPNDINNVGIGMRAEVHFSAFKQRNTPAIFGEVATVSADILLNERTGVGFYRATVRIPVEERRRLGPLVIQPGMPAEVLVHSGSRTMIQYLWTPIRDSLRRALKEA